MQGHGAGLPPLLSDVCRLHAELVGVSHQEVVEPKTSDVRIIVAVIDVDPLVATKGLKPAGTDVTRDQVPRPD